MIINSFHPGMIVETLFLMPGATVPKPRNRHCVVMSVHVKGLLVHPLMPKGMSAEAHAVYTSKGRVACDLRNIIESPASYAIAQRMQRGMPVFAKALLDEKEFAALREISLECAYNGMMKCERLKGAPPPSDRRRSA